MDIIDVEAHEVENSASDNTLNENTSSESISVSSNENLYQKPEDKVERFSTSSSKNKTYSSVKREGDVFENYSNNNNTNYYDNQKKNYISNTATRNTLMIIILIATSPVWIPIICSIFGVMIGLICAAFGVVFGVGCAGLGIVVAGITLFVVGVCKLLLTPLMAVTLIGCGILLTGLGLALATVMLTIGCKVLPIFGRMIGKFVAWLCGKVGKKHE